MAQDSTIDGGRGATPTPAPEPGQTRPPIPAQRAALAAWIALAALLAGATYYAGLPGLNSPWLPGDEVIFITDNPDVTGAGRSEPPLVRFVQIFSHTHDDLYQPVPILLFAIEWALAGESAVTFRRTDLLIHTLNALLVWLVLWRLSRLFQVGRQGSDAGATQLGVLSWFLALVWALHPALAHAWAADMGATHLLAATFGLLALLAYVRSMQRGGWRPLAALVVLLVLANLSKAVPGWLLLAVVLEAAIHGWRSVLRSPRVWFVAMVSIAFAALALQTSRASGLVDEASKGLFGDPLTRSLLAVWVYVRSMAAPFWLSAWYLPDPATGWSYLLVWLGLACTLASLASALWLWRTPATRGAAVGWAWFWGVLLPVLGLVGAREAVAADRYLYQPLIGVLLVAGVLLQRFALGPAASGTHRTAQRIALAALGIAALLLAVGAVRWDYSGVGSPPRLARSVVRKAERVVAQNPGDPRALEMLSAACDFARNHPLCEIDRPESAASRSAGAAPTTGTAPRDVAQPFATAAEDAVAARVAQFQHFHARFSETLRAAAAAPDLPRYFPTAEDRAQFHRRLSYRTTTAGLPVDALMQAQESERLDPGASNTWLALARAYRALGRFDEARAAFEKREPLLPDDPQTRAAHYTNLGDLLLRDMNDPAAGLAAFRSAVATGAGPTRAQIGLALCEIRAGQGAEGLRAIQEVLKREPGNTEALLILGEYHLRSHHWEDAGPIYAAILRRDPTNYDALLGFHEFCAHTKRWRDAALAWNEAVRNDPDNRAFRSFLIWAAACAGDPDAADWVNKLLAADPANPLACLARMMIEARAGRIDEAIVFAERVREDEGIPRARPLERGRATLVLMVERGELPVDAVILSAVLDEKLGKNDRAAATLRAYLSKGTESRWQELATRRLESLPRAADRP